MIFTWTMIIIVGAIGLIIAGVNIYGLANGGGKSCIAGLIASLVVAALICGGLAWWLYNTEGGKRAIKDTQSNISGGIERTVTVYDFDGDVLQQYTGKFDVSYDSERIKFDDEKGKRHVIYYTTGTVIIDEN
ncbi:hypothetical protein NE683_12205 [Bariatricus massiliensis]|uniref:Uncharacterized protein n=1 Tax=Bariatricus massiliensis TaxID=1745713 RepID=A0ABS8DGZ6_9FIRM|nr:hypothetical protein [Bariatricus massiliensis]MCB7306158.1 hypothetical protein [Bariatricus massiliensis]MCB7375236.1 hypothetical protein [Bariatricus massiliensis]MCB7387696.1 hypothetical protein [Bariatricus massiliensis]MCB7411857.1 hypothetical protein [Bariatricus massiliensis]MCQ5253993.1 hypothetical protein [Bariatricus massiliensis]